VSENKKLLKRAKLFFSGGETFWERRFPVERAETFLKERERHGPGVCWRYLNRAAEDKMWFAESHFLFFSKRSLFPLFDTENLHNPLPLPRRLERELAKNRLHGLQGEAPSIDILEDSLGALGIAPAERIDYDLLELDSPGEAFLALHAQSGPPGLEIKLPAMSDLDALIPLQAGYEYEEVLPKKNNHTLAVTRAASIKLIEGRLCLMAFAPGAQGKCAVGKININAESWTRFQLGGVYVAPAWRGAGIARAMAAHLLLRLLPRGKGFTLFARKQNAPAQAVYKRLGFKKYRDYRIDYFT
jgi:ribosomal protein S18 acetylase RimI-like enzyme